jgi:hypothetical protein
MITLPLPDDRLPGGHTGIEKRCCSHVIDSIRNRQPRAVAYQCLLSHPAVGAQRRQEPHPGAVGQSAYAVQANDLGKVRGA